MQATGVYQYAGWVFIALLCYNPIISKFIPSTNFGEGMPDLDPLRVLAYSLVLIFFIEYLIGAKARQITIHPWIAIVFVYVLVVVASPLWSPVYYYNSVLIQELFNSVVLPFLIAFIALVLFRDRKIVQRYCYNIALASIILSVFAITQFVQGSSVVLGEIRSVATFDNPNSLAVYLVLSQAVVLYATDSGRINKKLGYIAQVLLVLAVFTTVSKKGLVTMAITFLLYYWVINKKGHLVAVSVLIVSMFIAAIGFSHFAQRFADDEIKEQMAGKNAMALAGVDMFLKNPIIGLGYKGYYENFGRYFPNYWLDKYDAHNEYVTAMANYGLVGFVPFMAVFLYPLIWGWKRIRRLPKPYLREDRIRILVGVISTITFMINQYYAGTLFYQNIVVFLLYANIALMLTTPIIKKKRTGN